MVKRKIKKKGGHGSNPSYIFKSSTEMRIFGEVLEEISKQTAIDINDTNGNPSTCYVKVHAPKNILTFVTADGYKLLVARHLGKIKGASKAFLDSKVGDSNLFKPNDILKLALHLQKPVVYVAGEKMNNVGAMIISKNKKQVKISVINKDKDFVSIESTDERHNYPVYRKLVPEYKEMKPSRVTFNLKYIRDVVNFLDKINSGEVDRKIQMANDASTMPARFEAITDFWYGMVVVMPFFIGAGNKLSKDAFHNTDGKAVEGKVGLAN